VGHRQQRRRC